ncbi:putative two-component system sensor kinase [Nostocoides japonicum T1-X7]|uniref:Putative two-component system sensor kinase n=1 Tax=Nostocoides japonicum T1-X7 TaxID=1194083 RepID=A0A077LVB8_9MICO|nr:sensor histidine kinase [Tetrasphaera japonica]CCH76702.1 putative two-component system sensor kinase [Tetrasphaera japonica T1-X7]
MKDSETPRWTIRGVALPEWPYTAIFFTSIWLVYLLDPIKAAWELRHTTAGVVGIVTTVAFAVVYMWHFMVSRRFAWGVDPGQPVDGGSSVRRYLRYALLAALALSSTLAVGQEGTTTWVFVAVAGLWTFGFIVGVAVSAAIAVAYEICIYHVPGWHRDNGVSLAIALAVLAVGGGMLAARRQRDLAAARRENAWLLVQEERNRMARDLHDILGHSLTVITVKAELAGRLVEVAPERAKVEIESLETLAREALADVRGAVEGFREISLAGELARAREALGAAGIEARLPRSVDEIPADVRELYAWAIREGVTNVIRHSNARQCSVTMSDRELSIVDDGPGEATTGAGNGLRGLRERASAVGAVLETTGGPDGFRVRIVVPSVEAIPSGSAAGDSARAAGSAAAGDSLAGGATTAGGRAYGAPVEVQR